MIGLVLGIVALRDWSDVAFGGLVAVRMMRLIIPSGMSIMVGLHLIYGAFFLGLLQIQSSDRRSPRPLPVPPAAFRL